ncbi:hypothetical protein ASZ90_013269 [hydrocarbon metagenome]|uniref:Uncharacterized protein n=1 Tax=hydrocarbon metagenome TaxID=938273 RepID=A0A0W8F865_9ZZZZ
MTILLNKIGSKTPGDGRLNWRAHQLERGYLGERKIHRCQGCAYNY